MTIWIVTTGNSDVQLNTNANWKNLFTKVRGQFNNRNFEPFPVEDEEEERFTVPARVMGIVYGEQPEKDLHFPLLDTFSKLLHDKKVKPDKIIFILTDQENLFSSTNRRKNSPYWQDTYTLKPIFERYFKQNFPYTKVIEKTLQPKSGEKGLDNWNQVLTMVGNILSDPDVEFKKGGDVYVSHQAGTPAISSAVQFMSLSRFGKKVKFLVSNEYSKSADIVESSTYLRGIQIQQVKALIYPGGSPGAAKKLIEVEKIGTQTSELDELDKLVNFFNLNRSEVEDGKEFEIAAATQRIVDALDLIGRFFNNKNYLQGITLLAAGQETFLKVAIKKEIQGKILNLQIKGKSQTFNAEDLIQWQQAGLLFIRNPKDKGIYTDNLLKQVLNLTDNEEVSKIKIEVLQQVNFPVSDFSKKLDKKNFDVINSNDGLLKWLRQLRSDFKAWKLLEWSCILKDKNSQYEDDLRNQLMHNLVGVVETEVIQYLLGYKEDLGHTDDVSTTYEKMVKEPFMKALKDLDLPYKENNLQKKLQEVADTIH